MSVAELNSLITATISLLNQVGPLVTQVTQSYVYLNDFLGLLWNAVSTVTGIVGSVMGFVGTVTGFVTGTVHTVVQFFAGL